MSQTVVGPSEVLVIGIVLDVASPVREKRAGSNTKIVEIKA